MKKNIKKELKELKAIKKLNKELKAIIKLIPAYQEELGFNCIRFNDMLLDMVFNKKLSRDTYLEYLQMTQGDIDDIFEDCDFSFYKNK